jgi:hypothetical protein
MICIGASCPVNNKYVAAKVFAAPAPENEEPGLFEEIWNGIVDIAKFAVGAEDSPNLPPVASVVTIAGCSGDLEPTNQIQRLREDGIAMEWQADAMEDGAVKNGAWKFEKAEIEVEGTGERYQEEQLQAVSSVLAGEGWDTINKMEILVYLNPYLIGQDIVDAAVCEPGLYNISLDNAAEAAKFEHTRLPITVIGYTIRDNITGEETIVVLSEPAALQALCIDPQTGQTTLSGDLLRLPVPASFYPQDSDDPHKNRANISLFLDLFIDNTNVIDPSDEYLTYITSELEAD